MQAINDHVYLRPYSIHDTADTFYTDKTMGDFTFWLRLSLSQS